jgi:hypothetical protein
MNYCFAKQIRANAVLFEATSMLRLLLLKLLLNSFSQPTVAGDWNLKPP